jgi:hypothetical protein
MNFFINTYFREHGYVIVFEIEKKHIKTNTINIYNLIKNEERVLLFIYI